MTEKAIIDYLNQRAAPYGGTAADILDKTPSILWDNAQEIRKYWDVHDLSHVFPQSQYPHLANNWDNIIPEESEVNQARGNETMTHSELVEAEQNSNSIAIEIDNIYLDDDPSLAADLISNLIGGV